MKLSHFLGMTLFALSVSGGVSASAQNSPQENATKPTLVDTEVPVGLVSVVVVGSVLVVGTMAIFGNKWDDALEENPTDVWDSPAENESANPSKTNSPETDNPNTNNAIADDAPPKEDSPDPG